MSLHCREATCKLERIFGWNSRKSEFADVVVFLPRTRTRTTVTWALKLRSLVLGNGTNLSEGCPADNLSELEVVPNPDQRDVAEWSEESGEDDNDSDEDESCAWLYERW